MRAGTLRYQYTIQQRGTATQNSHGEDTTPWEDLVTVWMAMEPLSGREFFAAQATQSEVTHQATMRYRSGITTAMRITKDSRVWDIESVTDVTERHRELRLMCVERGV